MTEEVGKQIHTQTTEYPRDAYDLCRWLYLLNASASRTKRILIAWTNKENPT